MTNSCCDILAASMLGNPARTAKLVVIVAGAATFAGAVIWTVWIVLIFRRELHRSRIGACMQCGYDLSHSEGICPECGAVIRR